MPEAGALIAAQGRDAGVENEHGHQDDAEQQSDARPCQVPRTRDWSIPSRAKTCGKPCRDCKRIPPRPPAAVESAACAPGPRRHCTTQSPGSSSASGAILAIGMMLWSLSAGLWTVWRGLAVLRRRGARHRRRRHPAIAPGLPRPQQVAARRAALIRTAVVGVGYLGRFHAQKYASLPNSHLVGVADPSAKARTAVAAELGGRGATPIIANSWARRCREHRDPDAPALRSRQGFSRGRRQRAGREADDRDGGGGREPHRSWRAAPIASCRSAIWSASMPRCRRCSRP